jgi:chemotaxis family two-component system response regulator Rcp1
MSFRADGQVIILMVEDNQADVAFFNEAVEATRTPAAVHVAGDGSEALRFLRRHTPFADAPRPDVIVMDLNLPIMNGHEVLADMASDAALRTIPVAVLTTSTSDTAVCELYPAGRCLYFSKTDDFRQLQDIVRQIAAHARRPTGHGSA